MLQEFHCMLSNWFGAYSVYIASGYHFTAEELQKIGSKMDAERNVEYVMCVEWQHRPPLAGNSNGTCFEQYFKENQDLIIPTGDSRDTIVVFIYSSND